MANSIITEEEGRVLVNLARDEVAAFLKEGTRIGVPASIPGALRQSLGVFVSLKQSEGKEKIISSMGFPLSIKPLAEGVIDSARAAAIRAKASGLGSLDGVIVEVSIIGNIDPVHADQRTKLQEQIKIGEDGILVERGFHRALYLPHVAIEHSWDSESFLSECCVKAGLMPDAWLDRDTMVYKFKVIAFR